MKGGPEAGGRRPEAGSQRPEAGSRKPEARGQRPEAGSRKPEGNRCHRVYIEAGAKILGPVTIGDDAVVGANAVVTQDVPAGATVVGANRILSR